jgi:hypothetical protein
MVDGKEVFKNEVLKADYKAKLDADNKARYGEDYSPCRISRQSVTFAGATYNHFTPVQIRRQKVMLKAYDHLLLNSKMGV